MPKTKTKPKPAARKKSRGARKAASRKKSPARKKSKREKSGQSRRKQEVTFPITGLARRGLDLESGGQSGDTQGLSRREEEDSESVAELTEEGQYFEASAVRGVEDAKDPDEAEVTTSEVPEDDVPPEYTDRD